MVQQKMYEMLAYPFFGRQCYISAPYHVENSSFPSRFKSLASITGKFNDNILICDKRLTNFRILLFYCTFVS
jgi:hypothetical protein